MEASRDHKKIILYSVPGKEGFYKKLGFLKMLTAMAIFKMTVKTNMPNAQIPTVIFHSVKLGTYSTISCKGEGMNHGMIRTIALSIQMAT